MNPNQYRVSEEQYKEFLKHLAWQRLQAPDYRLGQAFLNYFPEVSKMMSNDGDLGAREELKLFYENNDLECQKIIDRWVKWLDQ